MEKGKIWNKAYLPEEAGLCPQTRSKVGAARYFFA